MEINALGNDKFEVNYDGKNEVLTLDEVMFLLSRPAPRKEMTHQERMEEFWRSEPAYPKGE